MFLKYRIKYSAGQQFTGEVTYRTAANKIVVSVQEGIGQLSLMVWLNHEPVVFMATAGNRPVLFSWLFTSVVHALARVSHPHRHFLYENGGGWSDGWNGVRWPEGNGNDAALVVVFFEGPRRVGFVVDVPEASFSGRQWEWGWISCVGRT